MTSHTPSFVPRSASAYAHLFENRLTNVPLGLYWTLCVELEPLVDEDGDEWDANVQFEWLSWPIRDWRELTGCSLATGGTRVEASIYAYARHQPITSARFELRASAGPRFLLDAALVFDLADLEEGIHEGLKADLSTMLDFEGLLVVPENLCAKPTDADAVLRALAPFADMSVYGPLPTLPASRSSGDEVRLLTYIRPRADLDQPRGRAMMGYSRAGSPLLSRTQGPWTLPGYADAGSTCSPSVRMLATAVDLLRPRIDASG